MQCIYCLEVTGTRQSRCWKFQNFKTGCFQQNDLRRVCCSLFESLILRNRFIVRINKRKGTVFLFLFLAASVRVLYLKESILTKILLCPNQQHVLQEGFSRWTVHWLLRNCSNYAMIPHSSVNFLDLANVSLLCWTLIQNLFFTASSSATIKTFTMACKLGDDSMDLDVILLHLCGLISVFSRH